MKVKVYQLKLESGYTFMNYEYAKDIMEMEDYELVAEFNLNQQTDSPLDLIYMMGNDGTLAMNFEMRSISVSDIIELDGIKYFVDSFGFKQI